MRSTRLNFREIDMKKRVFILLISICFALPMTAMEIQKSYKREDKSWYVPDSVKIQYGGSIGFLSVGAGYELFENYVETALFYGYLDKSIGGTDIHTLSWKNSIKFLSGTLGKRFKFCPFYFGMGLNISSGNNLIFVANDKYPKDYYGPTAFYMTPFIGTSASIKAKKGSLIKGFGAYLEIGTVYTYIKYYTRNRSLELQDILSTSFGVIFDL